MLWKKFLTWLAAAASQAAQVAFALSLSVNIAQADSSQVPNNGVSMSAVRTYMPFADQIDPAHILTMADLELSFALSSTLVNFDENRELASGLARSWKNISDNKIQFNLRNNLLWSDGSEVTAEQYKKALYRAKKIYPADLKPLFDAIKSIEAPDAKTIVITTINDVRSSGIILKLTEPMYGLVAVNARDEIDLSKSVGPYFVKTSSKDLLILSLNPNWYLRKADMPTQVEIKRPHKGQDLLAEFADDNWANLITSSSIVKQDTLEALKKQGCKTWQRTEDKMFGLFPSKTFIKRGGSEILKSMSVSIKKQDLLSGWSGFSIAEQFFPRGYSLWSSSLPKLGKPNSTKSIDKLKLIIPDSYFALPIKERMAGVIKQALGSVEVSIDFIPLIKLSDRMNLQDFDILVTGIAVADPNFEGAVSFFVERDPPFVPSEKAPNDFAHQVKVARALHSTQERAEAMKSILIRAQEVGYVLPLFHYSSLAIAKPGVDLSEIPNTDETIHFAKVRMKK